MHVDPGTLRLEASTPATGHQRCLFKSMERVVGAADALAAELSVDTYHLSTPESARQHAIPLGSPALVVRTATPGNNGDNAYALGEQIGLDVNREPGFALVHGLDVVVLQMSGSFMQDRPAGWAYAMQSFGLRLAGAQVLGPLYPDSCDIIPRAQLQTLVTLQPATLVPDATGSMSSCLLRTQNPDGTRGEGNLTITIRRHQDPQQIQMAEGAGSRGLLAHGTNADDRTVIPGRSTGKVTAIHADTVATLEVSDPDVHAIVSPSYAYRLQRAALQAAGATVVATTQYGPDPVAQTPKPPAKPTALDSLSHWWANTHPIFWLPWIFVALILLTSSRRRTR